MKDFLKENAVPAIAALICFMIIISLMAALSTGQTPDVGGILLLVLLIPAVIVIVYACLYVFSKAIISIDNATTNAGKSLNKWLNQPDTGNKRADALGVDYVNETVNYAAERLGGKNGISFSRRTEKGMFTIDGDYITVGDIAFRGKDIQWLGLSKRSDYVRLDVNIDGWWHQINIYPGYDGDDFLKELRKRVPTKLNVSRYTRRPEIRTYVGVPAHITNQNLQGIFEKQEAVELHVTPLWLVVLRDGYVMQQHFIDDISDIRSTKHPTDLDDDMLLLTFEVGEEAFAYALKDKNFTTRLTDAAKQGYDASAARKKKKQDM